VTGDIEITTLDEHNHAAVRQLILAGLEERWGKLDATLNHDLENMLVTYAEGRTVVVLRDALVVATGTLLPLPGGAAKIVRMSVDRTARRAGLACRIVDELIATAREWGVSSVEVETNTSWTSAVDLYKACGFAVTSVSPVDEADSTEFELRL